MPVARAHEQQPLVGRRALGEAQRRDHARERHRGGVLDVVVVAADAVAVLGRQAERVVAGEVLELDHGAGEHLGRGADELVDGFVVGCACQAGLRQAPVQRIIAQRLVAGADAQHHRQALRGLLAGARGTQRELGDRDGHAAGTQVAQAEEALAVGDEGHRHLAVGRLAPHACSMPARAAASRRAGTRAAPGAGPGSRGGWASKASLSPARDRAWVFTGRNPKPWRGMAVELHQELRRPVRGRCGVYKHKSNARGRRRCT